ncbi:hypothetical protein [Candidatus Poriferisocius sp.]|uniref:hypothetical protein n=1 Tax=Candidatus Poriferisocius sp. TaxID=3101276 RepID=UPI003B5C0030
MTADVEIESWEDVKTAFLKGELSQDEAGKLLMDWEIAFPDVDDWDELWGPDRRFELVATGASNQDIVDDIKARYEANKEWAHKYSDWEAYPWAEHEYPIVDDEAHEMNIALLRFVEGFSSAIGQMSTTSDVFVERW